MKSFTKCLLLFGVSASLLLATGCSKKEYTFYTNMSDSDYAIIDKSYKSGGFIEGLSLDKGEDEAIDISGYTAKEGNYFAMMAPATMVVYSDFSTEEKEEQFDELSERISAKLYEIEKSISTTNPFSDIYKFNEAPAGEKLEIGFIAYEVLSQSQSVYSLTEGYYNPALYYNVQAYGFGGAEEFPEKLPDDGIIEKYTALALRFGDMKLSEQDGKYFVTKPEYTVEVEGESLSMKLDLGGIGKGYAVDCVDELLDEYGYKFAYFSFATSSMLVKNNITSSRNYNLGLANPRSPYRSPYLATTIRNEKLSTSGDDEQAYFVGGVRYCHIIDPTTGKPVQKGIMSVSVIGGGAAEADALTTAIMCMGKDKAIQFIQEKLNDRRVVFTVE